MIASPNDPLDEAIDLAFARWDHSYLHVCEFGDGSRYMNGGSEFEPDVIDSAGVTVGSLDPREGDSFEYVFDPGDDWRRKNSVQPEYYWPWMLGDLILIIVAVVTVGAWTVTFIRNRGPRSRWAGGSSAS